MPRITHESGTSSPSRFFISPGSARKGFEYDNLMRYSYSIIEFDIHYAIFIILVNAATAFLEELLDRLNVIAPENGFLRQNFGRINIVEK